MGQRVEGGSIVYGRDIKGECAYRISSTGWARVEVKWRVTQLLKEEQRKDGVRSKGYRIGDRRKGAKEDA